MCAVSNVGDDWSKRSAWPDWPKQIPFPDRNPTTIIPAYDRLATLVELQQLRKQVKQMKAELEAAKAQDIAEGNADCEMEDKVIILKKIAKMFGIELKEIFPE